MNKMLVSNIKEVVILI